MPKLKKKRLGYKKVTQRTNQELDAAFVKRYYAFITYILKRPSCEQIAAVMGMMAIIFENGWYPRNDKTKKPKLK